MDIKLQQQLLKTGGFKAFIKVYPQYSSHEEKTKNYKY